MSTDRQRYPAPVKSPIECVVVHCTEAPLQRAVVAGRDLTVEETVCKFHLERRVL